MELRPDLWHCADCGTAYAVGLTCCPQCSSEHRAGAVTGLQEHPGYGVPMTGIEHPADGTMSPPVSSDEPEEM
jgi:hypothetical protein